MDDPRPPVTHDPETNRIVADAFRLEKEGEALREQAQDMNPQEAIDLLHGHAAKLEGNITELDIRERELYKEIENALDTIDQLFKQARDRATTPDHPDPPS